MHLTLFAAQVNRLVGSLTDYAKDLGKDVIKIKKRLNEHDKLIVKLMEQNIEIMEQNTYLLNLVKEVGERTGAIGPPVPPKKDLPS